VDVAAEPVTRPAGKLRGLTHAQTSFIGRSDAVDKVLGLLDSYRLVTVTGPGGVGKTRLADEVLKQVAGRFVDGVGVVELAAVSEPPLVAATVATALEVHQAAGMSIVDALAERLSRQQLLLVLDNCEHVLDAAAELCAALLVSADDVKILATSREPLGLPEEARYRLPSLTLPDPSVPGTAVQAEAVALFVERARQLDPDFTVDGDSGYVLARLVQRLDGMPLAIELAAARVEALGLTQLLDRLDDRFRLLVSANRAATARQRSLEATVDWSYQLLSGSEQLVFRRLAVFPGSFTLDAAEAVAGVEAGSAVLRLVDCSLLVPPATGPDGRSRYLMLETLRGYGRSRLREAGEEQDAAAALAVHALHVAEHAAAQMAVRSGERPAALWLDAEDAAIHQGLAWALEHDRSAALRLAVALAPWWLLRGQWIQGTGLLRRAVEETGPDAGIWYTAHVWLGHLARGTFDYDIALRHYSTVVEALADEPPSPDLVDGLVGRCAVLRNTAPLEEATADARAALELARQISYLTGEAMALTELGIVSSYADDGDRAVEWARQAQRIDRDPMPGWYARKVEHVLPYVMVMSGHLDGAGELCVRALAQAKAAGDLSHQADALYLMASLARQTGRLADARAPLREVVELATHAGYRLRLIDALDEGGYLCAAAGQYTAAITLWAARAAQAESTGLADIQEEIHRREQPLREARQALDAEQVRAAQARGAAMTLAAAAEFAIITTDDGKPELIVPPGPGRLSSRERELVTLVARGQTDAQIAEQLFISVSTVRTHLDRIRDKSGCRRRADLTRLALQAGII
jgi:predicted ATPase/DNA-binding CsgD family transcriptional regulator